MNKVDTIVSKFKSEVIDPIKDEVRDAKDKITWLIEQIKAVPQLIKELVDIALNNFKSAVIDPIKNLVDEARSNMRMVIRFITQLPGKIKQFGENIGELLKVGLVDPFMTLFEAMGHMFVMTGNIVMKIIDKIKTLPNCSILYIFQSVYATVNAIYKAILPGFIVDIMSTIYTYTLKILVDFISWLFGLDEWWDKCLSFNVDDEVNSIKDKFDQVGPAFKNSFGKMDFKDLIDFSDNPKQDEKMRAAKEKEDLLSQQELGESLDAS